MGVRLVIKIRAKQTKWMAGVVWAESMVKSNTHPRDVWRMVEERWDFDSTTFDLGARDYLGNLELRQPELYKKPWNSSPL